MKPQACVAGNIELLEQAARLLGQLPAGGYARPHPAVCRTGIGGMVRHVLDFYGCFLNGLDAGWIDYDARARAVTLEHDPDAARRRIAEVIGALCLLASDDLHRPLRVRAEDVGAGAAEWAHSSVARELTFLLSHTVHHFALIAAMLRLAGIEPPTGFGVAFSTLAHEQRQRAQMN